MTFNINQIEKALPELKELSDLVKAYQRFNYKTQNPFGELPLSVFYNTIRTMINPNKESLSYKEDKFVEMFNHGYVFLEKLKDVSQYFIIDYFFEVLQDCLQEIGSSEEEEKELPKPFGYGEPSSIIKGIPKPGKIEEPSKEETSSKRLTQSPGVAGVNMIPSYQNQLVLPSDIRPLNKVPNIPLFDAYKVSPAEDANTNTAKNYLVSALSPERALFICQKIKIIMTNYHFMDLSVQRLIKNTYEVASDYNIMKSEFTSFYNMIGQVYLHKYPHKKPLWTNPDFTESQWMDGEKGDELFLRIDLINILINDYELIISKSKFVNSILEVMESILKELHNFSHFSWKKPASIYDTRKLLLPRKIDPAMFDVVYEILAEYASKIESKPIKFFFGDGMLFKAKDEVVDEIKSPSKALETRKSFVNAVINQYRHDNGLSVPEDFIDIKQFKAV